MNVIFDVKIQLESLFFLLDSAQYFVKPKTWHL